MCLNSATFAFFILVSNVVSLSAQLEDKEKGTEIIFDINDEHKAQYLNQNFYSNAYNYGYEVSPNGQFHHEVHGPDNVTYGCYGYVDPLGKLKTTFYISDGWGYRVVKPGQNVELYFQEHDRHENDQSQKHDNDDRHDHHGILTAWNKLHFPSICAQFEGTYNNPNVIPLLDHGTSPEIIGIPKNHVTPGTPETPSRPIYPENPKTPAVPRRQEHPGVPTSPKTPDLPKGSEIPETHRTPLHPKYPEKPGTPETYSTPKIPGRPRVLDIPETPETPSHPGFHRESARPTTFSTPVISKESSYPEYPKMSGTSVTPGKPYKPSYNDAPRTPIIIEKPSPPVHSSLPGTMDISVGLKDSGTFIIPNPSGIPSYPSTSRKSETPDISETSITPGKPYRPPYNGTPRTPIIIEKPSPPVHSSLPDTIDISDGLKNSGTFIIPNPLGIPSYPSTPRKSGTSDIPGIIGTPLRPSYPSTSEIFGSPNKENTSGIPSSAGTPSHLPQPVYSDTPPNSDTESNTQKTSDAQDGQDNSDKNTPSHSSIPDSSTTSDTPSGLSGSEEEASQSSIHSGTLKNLPLTADLRTPGTSSSSSKTNSPEQPVAQSSSGSPRNPCLTEHSRISETESHSEGTNGLETSKFPGRPKRPGDYVYNTQINPSRTQHISEQSSSSGRQRDRPEYSSAAETSDTPSRKDTSRHHDISKTESYSEYPVVPKAPLSFKETKTDEYPVTPSISSTVEISSQPGTSGTQQKPVNSDQVETSDTSSRQDTSTNRDISKTESYSEYQVVPEAPIPFKKAKTDEYPATSSVSGSIEISEQPGTSGTQQKPAKSDQVEISDTSSRQDTSTNREISITESYSEYQIVPEDPIPFKKAKTDESISTRNKPDLSEHRGDFGKKQHAEYRDTPGTFKEQNILGYRPLPSHDNYHRPSDYPISYPSISVTSTRTGLFGLTEKLENMILRKPSHLIPGGHSSYPNGSEGSVNPEEPIGDNGGIGNIGDNGKPGPDGPWPTGSPGPDGPWPGDPKYYPGLIPSEQSQYRNPVKILQLKSYTPINTSLSIETNFPGMNLKSLIKSNSNFTSAINNGRLSEISSPIKVSEIVDIDHSRIKMQKYEHINGYDIYQENINHNAKAINSLMHDTLKTSDHLKYTFSKNQTNNLEKHEITDTKIKPYGLRTESNQNNRYEVTEDTNLAEEPETNFEQIPVNRQKHYRKEFQYLTNHSYEFQDIIKGPRDQPYKVDHQGSRLIVHTKFDKQEENRGEENIDFPEEQVELIKQENSSSEGEQADHGIIAIGVQPPHPINVKSFSSLVEPNSHACPCYLVESYKEHDITSSTTPTPLIGQLGFIPVIFVPYCPNNKVDNYKMKLMYPSATSVPYVCNVCDTSGGTIETKLIGLDQLNNVENLKGILSHANLGFLNVPIRPVSQRRKIRRRKIT